jgi:hypothetical protein
VMNSRRLMVVPIDDDKLPHCAIQQNWPPMSLMGLGRVKTPASYALRNQSTSRRALARTRHVRAARPTERTSRDFVPWRFSDAGLRSAWIARRCRRPKTCT